MNEIVVFSGEWRRQDNTGRERLVPSRCSFTLAEKHKGTGNSHRDVYFPTANHIMQFTDAIMTLNSLIPAAKSAVNAVDLILFNGPGSCQIIYCGLRYAQLVSKILWVAFLYSPQVAKENVI